MSGYLVMSRHRDKFEFSESEERKEGGRLEEGEVEGRGKIVRKLRDTNTNLMSKRGIMLLLKC